MRRGLGLLGLLVTIAVVAVVGVIAYNVGWSDGLAQHLPEAGSTAPPAGYYPYYYGGPHFFGFGWIFDQKQPSKWAVVVWAVTWALIGTFFGFIAGAVPDYTLAKQVGAGISGATVGGLFGFVIGILRERKFRRRVMANS